MVTENTTPNRGYQEPAVGNTLKVDIDRLVSALRAIDIDVANALAAIVSKAGLASPVFTGTPTAPTAAPGTDSGQLATTAFVKAALTALVDSAPGALDTLNELADAIGDDPNFAATMAALIGTKADAAATTAALAGKADAAATTEALAGKVDTAAAKWLSKAIGEFYAVDDSMAGADVPPTNDSRFRFIKLTAGLTGSGQYNDGILTTESVSGSAPLVSATAVVNLTGSPVNGRTVRLINTERRFLRAGSAGTVQDDALQNMVGTWGNSILRDAANVSGVFGTTTDGPSNAAGAVGGGSAGRGVSFDASRVARTDTETRTKNIGVTYYMRIK